LLRAKTQYAKIYKERLTKMCPCLSSRSNYATCSRFTDGLMVPSVFERENYCLALYKLCPLFTYYIKLEGANIKERECELAGVGV